MAAFVAKRTALPVEVKTFGYRNLHRDDRLVLVFTTSSSKSGDITSFSARLFGRLYP
jgi:hypothetical protein